MAPLSPTQLVCQKFGGASELAKILGIRPASISYWESRGKGRIPSAQQLPILKAAAKRNIHLTAAELVLGGGA